LPFQGGVQLAELRRYEPLAGQHRLARLFAQTMPLEVPSIALKHISMRSGIVHENYFWADFVVMATSTIKSLTQLLLALDPSSFIY